MSDREEYARWAGKEGARHTEALLNAWDDGYLRGMEELYATIATGLKSAEPVVGGDLYVTDLLNKLGEAFRWEVVCCGDVMPFEFEVCWRKALAEVGAVWAEPPREGDE